MPARIVLLVTSPRLPAGLLSAAAWDLVRATKQLPWPEGCRRAEYGVSLYDTRSVLSTGTQTQTTIEYFSASTGFLAASQVVPTTRWPLTTPSIRMRPLRTSPTRPLASIWRPFAIASAFRAATSEAARPAPGCWTR